MNKVIADLKLADDERKIRIFELSEEELLNFYPILELSDGIRKGKTKSVEKKKDSIIFIFEEEPGIKNSIWIEKVYLVDKDDYLYGDFKLAFPLGIAPGDKYRLECELKNLIDY